MLYARVIECEIVVGCRGLGRHGGECVEHKAVQLRHVLEGDLVVKTMVGSERVKQKKGQSCGG